jgi:hypothetical protein
MDPCEEKGEVGAAGTVAEAKPYLSRHKQDERRECSVLGPSSIARPPRMEHGGSSRQGLADGHVEAPGLREVSSLGVLIAGVQVALAFKASAGLVGVG